MKMVRAAMWLGCAAVAAHGVVVWERGANGGAISVNDDGTYWIEMDGKPVLWSNGTAMRNNGSWLHEGAGLVRVGAGKVSGSDTNLGPWDGYEIRYTFANGARRFTTTFKYYGSEPLLLFEQSYPDGATNTNNTGLYADGTPFLTATNEFNGSMTPVALFPSFRQDASFNYGIWTWGGRFAVFSPYTSLADAAGGQVGGPIIIYDTTGRMTDTALVWSPFDNLKSNIIGVQPGAGIGAGLLGYATSVPQGTVVTSCIYFDAGITTAMHGFGRAMQKSAGRTTPKPVSIFSSHLSYWTDNGAFYDFYVWHNRTADGTPEYVLKQLAKQYRDKKVPISYWQLDAYWYPEVVADADCKINDTVDARWFPSGLQNLSDEIGPLVLYTGTTCDNSTYWKENGGPWDAIYSYEYHHRWANGRIGNVHPDHSFDYYDSIFKKGKATQGMAAFEIDFMDFNYMLFPYLLTNVTASEAWMRGMADAAKANDLNIQYCMALPNDFLMAVHFDAVTNGRASQDYQPGWFPNAEIGGPSLLFSALGLRPYKDNFWTSTHQHDPVSGHSGTEPNSEVLAAISVMSSGPVGIADMLGATNYSLILPTYRADGTLLQGSRPATPLESSIFTSPPRMNGQNTHTHSLIGSRVWYSGILANTAPQVTIVPDDLYPRPSPGSTFVVYLWNARCADGSKVGECVMPLDAAIQVPKPPPATVNYQMFNIARVSDAGHALLGEVDKYVMVSPQRFTSVNVTTSGVAALAIGSPGEALRVAFLVSNTLRIVSVTIPQSGVVTVTSPQV